eukprot:TRINITY_DN15713_c0_g1_i1.p1 TRINITY_DN15713_c0_g1~~TRINITY_DN15713_c0_g1_i1.p1  ORF type:complete len:251 (-),score=49.69 TRINITY_DN15713_c0_g1_i1:50-802(-)
MSVSRIDQLTYVNDRWVLLSEKYDKDPIIEQRLYTGEGEFPQKPIEKMWKKGFRIRHISYGQRMWVVLVERMKRPAPAQTLATSNDFPTEKIKRAWDQRKRVQFLSFCNGMWILITERPEHGIPVNQSLITTGEIPKSEIEQFWREGKRLHCVAYGTGTWVLIAEHPLENTYQTFFATSAAAGPTEHVASTFPRNKIKSYYDKNKQIHTLLHVPDVDLWVLVAEEKYVTQAIYYDTEFPKDKLAKLGFPS